MADPRAELCLKFVPKGGFSLRGGVEATKKKAPLLLKITRGDIGTEVENVWTRTRYFNPNNTGGLPTCIEPSGHYQSIDADAFNRLLHYAETMRPRTNMKPINFVGDGKRPTTRVTAQTIDKFLAGMEV